MYLEEKDLAWAQETLERTAHKLEKVAQRSAEKIPYTTVDGVHDDKSGDKEIGWWTNGFWGGIMCRCTHSPEKRFTGILRNKMKRNLMPI